MDYMYELKEKLCQELDEIAEKSELSAGDLEMAHKLTDTIKNIDKIGMLEGGDYSQAGDWEMEGRGSYNRESSYANRGKHYVRGHYSRDGYARDGYSRERRMYSREGGKDRMMEEMEALMSKAGSEKEREAIRRCMSQLENA